MLEDLNANSFQKIEIFFLSDISKVEKVFAGSDQNLNNLLSR